MASLQSTPRHQVAITCLVPLRSPLDDVKMPTRDRSHVVDTAVVAVPEVQLLWVTPGSVPEVLNPVHDCRVDNRASEMLGGDSRFVSEHTCDDTHSQSQRASPLVPRSSPLSTLRSPLDTACG
ncbi:MAG: hypothetical protein SPJ05_04505 [Candidatus Limisoma sp.]|nr:hypothetical protein [Candidatus Limisoma sp.]